MCVCVCVWGGGGGEGLMDAQSLTRNISVASSHNLTEIGDGLVFLHIISLIACY